MIQVTDDIWVGDSYDESVAVYYVRRGMIDRVLVVAHDMKPVNGWEDGIEYMHVGLVDGPGNPLAAYHAAVLALVALVSRGKVMVCCHDGGRSLAVAIMYLYLVGGGPSWDEHIERLACDPTVSVLPTIHSAHKLAFSMMDWGMMLRVIDGEVSE